MVAYLNGVGLLDVVTKPPPSPEEDDSSSSASSEQKKEVSPLSPEKSLQQRNVAYSILINAMAPAVLHLVQAAPLGDPHAVWQALLDNYERSTLSSKAALRRQLHLSKLKDGETFSSFVQRVNESARLLTTMGDKVSDPECFTVILNGLPDSFDPIVTTLEADSDITYETACNRIRDFELKLKLRSKPKAGDATAYSAKKEKPPPSKQERKKRPCTHCGRTNHADSNCWIKYPEKMPKEFPRKARARGQSTPSGASGQRNEEVDYIFSASLSSSASQRWVMDSGSTNHICKQKTAFSSLSKCEPVKVTVANDEVVTATHRGDVKLSLKSGETLLLKGVLFSPKIARNLISISKIASLGYATNFYDDGFIVSRDTKSLRGIREGGLYVLETQPLLALNLNSSVSPSPPSSPPSPPSASPVPSPTPVTASNSLRLWHERLGHLNHQAVAQLQRLVTGLVLQDKKTAPCESCSMGKNHRQPFSRSTNKRAAHRLDLVHSDVIGPIHPQSIGGANYILTFLDDFSRKGFIYLLKRKSEVLEKFKHFHASVCNQTDRKLKRLRADNAYLTKEFEHFCGEHGIHQEFSTPHTPQQNGRAERYGRTILEMSRTLLLHSGMSKGFWAEAVSTAVYLRNLCPTRALSNSTPAEAWSGRKPDVSRLRVFGCLAFVHQPLSPKSDKFGVKSLQCRFLGYGTARKAYRLWDPANHKIVISHDVNFHESSFSIPSSPDHKDDSGSDDSDFEDLPRLIDDVDEDIEEDEFESAEEAKHPTSPPASVAPSSPPSPLRQPPLLAPSGASSSSPDEATASSRVEHQPVSAHSPHRIKSAPSRVEAKSTSPPSSTVRLHPPQSVNVGAPRRSTRSTKPKKYQGFDTRSSIRQPLYQDVDDESTNFVSVSVPDEPTSLAEAQSTPDAFAWMAAAKEEYNSLLENKTWTLTALPPGRFAISSRWVFKRKVDQHGSTRFKARLVARGFQQRDGFDYFADELYAPVARLKTIRCILALASHSNLHLHHMDVSTAFLNGKLDEDIYLQQPEGFVQRGKEHLVLHLHKGLYGLKQAPKAWFSNINSFLLKLGFTSSKFDPCLYIRRTGDQLTIVVLYVDDLIIASTSSRFQAELQRQLSDNYKMHDLGPLQLYLGLEIRQEPNQISVRQSRYTQQLLDKFNMANCKAAPTPLVPFDFDSTQVPDSSLPVRQAVGALLFLSGATRPDIAVAVNKLSQHVNTPTLQIWNGIKRVFRYLRGTLDYGLVYSRSSDQKVPQLITYSDATWAEDKADRKSTSGQVHLLCGAPISWLSKKQATVALSTAEAEFIALAASVQEVIFLRNLLAELGYPQSPTVVYEDNQATIFSLKNLGSDHNRTKHIDLRYFFLREKVADGLVIIKYVSTDNNVADALTKPLSPALFERFRPALVREGVN